MLSQQEKQRIQDLVDFLEDFKDNLDDEQRFEDFPVHIKLKASIDKFTAELRELE